MKTRLLLLFLVVMAFLSSCTPKKGAETSLPDSTAVAPAANEMIIHARIYLKPEKVADFIEAARAMIDSSNMEPGCLSYQLYQDPYDNTRFIFVESWKDQADIDAHFTMQYFTAFGPKTQDWLAQPTELKIFEVVSAK